jgi:hypothetical protein
LLFYSLFGMDLLLFILNDLFFKACCSQDSILTG